jgi:hypothetical protein
MYIKFIKTLALIVKINTIKIDKIKYTLFMKPINQI